MTLYVIRYDTWTVEATDVHDLRDLKFATELEAELSIEGELKFLKCFGCLSVDRYKAICLYLQNCRDRIQKLKQQSI
jgi:hypothetical protein